MASSALTSSNVTVRLKLFSSINRILLSSKSSSLLSTRCYRTQRSSTSASLKKRRSLALNHSRNFSQCSSSTSNSIGNGPGLHHFIARAQPHNEHTTLEQQQFE
ncbi:hypothetical protein ACFE04_023316 [Oxalis oulophora]